MALLNAEVIGARIKAKREALKARDPKWTQPYVANEINQRTDGKLQGADISRWETGQHVPSTDNMEALAEVLGTSVAEFYVAPADKSNGTPDPFAAGDDQLDRIEASVTHNTNLLLALADVVSEQGSAKQRAEIERLSAETARRPGATRHARNQK